MWWKEQRWKQLERVRGEGTIGIINHSTVERAGHVTDHVCSGHLEQGSNHYPREVAPQIAVEKTDVERIEEGSDDESEEVGKRTWKRSRVEMEDMRKVVVRDMFRMPSDDDEEDATVIKNDDRRASCPIFGCDWKTQKIRNHVNRMHLHRVMWDNPNPPVKQNKYHSRTSIMTSTTSEGKFYCS